jgi:hypothetical protein
MSSSFYVVARIDTAMANWTQPRASDIEQEYNVEYKHHLEPEYGDFWPTLEHFKRALAKAKVVTVTRSMDDKIQNRSGTRSFKELLSLIKGYASYPKYRNEKTLKALEQRIVDGEPTSMPIVLRFASGAMRIMGGNTRMDIGFWHANSVKVLMVDVPEVQENLASMPYLTFAEWASKNI